jgi:hypothetical protein
MNNNAPDAGHPGRLLQLSLRLVPGGQARAQNLKIVETEDLQVVYFDPSGATLARTSLEFPQQPQRTERLFGYQPDGKVSILLQDFSDRGNAMAILGTPHRIFIDVAPRRSRRSVPVNASTRCRTTNWAHRRRRQASHTTRRHVAGSAAKSCRAKARNPSTTT